MKTVNIYITTILLLLSALFCSMVSYAAAVDEINPISQNQQTTPININQATAEELAKGLNGIGLSKAKKIVEYRDKFGPFVSIEQLKEVSGIGQSILDRNSGRITL